MNKISEYLSQIEDLIDNMSNEQIREILNVEPEIADRFARLERSLLLASETEELVIQHSEEIDDGVYFRYGYMDTYRPANYSKYFDVVYDQNAFAAAVNEQMQNMILFGTISSSQTEEEILRQRLAQTPTEVKAEAEGWSATDFADITLPEGFTINWDLAAGVVCTHPQGFKEYNGFTESYKYCPVCDHKEK